MVEMITYTFISCRYDLPIQVFFGRYDLPIQVSCGSYDLLLQVF